MVELSQLQQTPDSYSGDDVAVRMCGQAAENDE